MVELLYFLIPFHMFWWYANYQERLRVQRQLQDQLQLINYLRRKR